jgi:hypothetical protein
VKGIDIKKIRTKKDFREFSAKLEPRSEVYYFIKKGHTYKACTQLEFQQILADQGWVMVTSSSDY